ncbi:hypothetical protein CN602_25330 [Bacillus cereus]|nr:spore germination protein [Bacillus cereus]PEL96949.1 hypothetical protein CN602_25330 [Bacillus cereus]
MCYLLVQDSKGVFNLGDFYNISPKKNKQNYNGSGSANVADQNQVDTA